MTATDVDKVEADMAACTKDLPDRDAKVVALKAWSMLRKGDATAALKLTGEETDDAADPHLLMARGEALAALRRTDEAIAAFRAAASADPLTTHCTYAMDLANRLAGTPNRRGDADTAMAKQASAYARKIPAWIDSTVSQPQLFQLVSIDQPPSRIGPLERGMLTLRIRNASRRSRWRWARASPSTARFLFSPMIEVAAIKDPPAVVPEVFEFDRRFRLMPRRNW
jgi:tetratricopeptide (TPR) repeat protein